MNKKIKQILDPIKDSVDIAFLIDVIDKLNRLDNEALDYILEITGKHSQMINEETQPVTYKNCECQEKRWDNSYNKELEDSIIECPNCHNQSYLITESGYLCEVCGKKFLADLC